MTYKTKGVCSREINFEVEDNKVKNVQFVGGCSGNRTGQGVYQECCLLVGGRVFTWTFFFHCCCVYRVV